MLVRQTGDEGAIPSSSTDFDGPIDLDYLPPPFLEV
jgi:hypothetical protein